MFVHYFLGHRRFAEEPGTTRMVSLERDHGGDLGFGIKGCPGRRPGVIISHVVPNSQAGRCSFIPICCVDKKNVPTGSLELSFKRCIG